MHSGSGGVIFDQRKKCMVPPAALRGDYALYINPTQKLLKKKRRPPISSPPLPARPTSSASSGCGFGSSAARPCTSASTRTTTSASDFAMSLGNLFTSMQRPHLHLKLMSDSSCNYHRKRGKKASCDNCGLQQLDWFDKQHNLIETPKDDDPSLADVASLLQTEKRQQASKAKSFLSQVNEMRRQQMVLERLEAGHRRAVANFQAKKEHDCLLQVLLLADTMLQKFAKNSNLKDLALALLKAPAAATQMVGQDTEIAFLWWGKLAQPHTKVHKDELDAVFKRLDRRETKYMSLCELFSTLHSITKFHDVNNIFKHYFITHCCLMWRKTTTNRDEDVFVSKLELQTLLSNYQHQPMADVYVTDALSEHTNSALWTGTTVTGAPCERNMVPFPEWKVEILRHPILGPAFKPSLSFPFAPTCDLTVAADLPLPGGDSDSD
eukprot:TRINITY_DN56100_c0_g1_i1.p1 TRINITY_DN56100_c0_g1~~TRINITY_DN56100_c0_g1_i1.p1  ORF type:complete len:437 (-),score=12.81 TRINITY_DN56100_c0_g1_i1:1426-2736(-)